MLFLKYLIASAIALLADYLIYFFIAKHTLLELGAASIFGYCSGLFVSYFFISKRVFIEGWLRKRRFLEIMLFGLSGLLGLILTYSSVTFYSIVINKNIHEAKFFAIPISFIGVYFFRKYFVFKIFEFN